MGKTRILRGTALGDAWGAGLEYAPPEDTETFTLARGFVDNPRYPEIRAGQFTDDTMLSVAATRALLADVGAGRVPCADTLYGEMVRLHRDHPSAGYSKPTREALDASGDAAALKAAFQARDRSESNGAAMRSACYGTLPDVASAMAAASACGAATHSGLGVRAAAAVAAASHYLHRGVGPREGLDGYVAAHAGPEWVEPYHGRVAPKLGPLASITVRRALTALREARTLSGVIEASVRTGGDTDTVGAIAMGLAASCPWLGDDLPEGSWDGAGIVPVSGLGWDELERLDRELGAMSATA